MQSFSAYHLITLYICIKFQENISKGFTQRGSDLLRQCGLYTKIFKGHNSVNSGGDVMVLVQSTLSDSFLYLFQVLSKYLIGFQSYGPKQQVRR